MISTKYELQKRTSKEYLIERVKRLFVPFVSGTIVLMPIRSYLADKKIVSKVENSCHLLLGTGLVATILNLYLFIWFLMENYQAI